MIVIPRSLLGLGLKASRGTVNRLPWEASCLFKEKSESILFQPRLGMRRASTQQGCVMPNIPETTLAVLGSDERFPVRRVYCIGRNYRDHVIEMGDNPDKDPPLFFMKPRDAAVDVSDPGATIPYPPETANLHHEVEMVIALGSGGRGITPERAAEHVFAYGVGVDLTRRDMQNEAKKVGRPWDCSKGFDSSGPIGTLTLAAGAATGLGDGDSDKREIWLKVDGVVRQRSVVGAMVWSVPEMIARLSQLFTLEPGDLLFTGTPAGVGPLRVGEKVEAGVDGLEPCRFEVGPLLPPTM